MNFVKRMNLSSLIPQSAIEVKSNAVNDNEKRKERRRQNYFRKLSNSTLQKLIDLYKIDFEMFGYDPWDYILTK